jgi:hypothetical protein
MTALDAENALYWLYKLFTAKRREGWEEGPSEDEVMDDVLCFLANAGIDPGIVPREKIQKEFLDRVEKRGNLYDWSHDMAHHGGRQWKVAGPSRTWHCAICESPPTDAAVIKYRGTK